MGDISKGVAKTLQAAKKYTKKGKLIFLILSRTRLNQNWIEPKSERMYSVLKILNGLITAKFKKKQVF
jgi:hypothetical protein